MALTITVGAVGFAALAHGTARVALAFTPKAPTAKNIREHVNGANGNYTTLCGINGGGCDIRAAYQGPYDTVLSNILTDLYAWAGKSVDIIAPGGKKLTRCKLDGCSVSGKPIPLGDNANCRLDVTYSFFSDGVLE